MGTLVSLSPLLGIFAGIITAIYSTEELKSGARYFVLLQHALLSILLIVLLWNSPLVALVSGIILFFILYRIRYSHPLETMPFFAILAVLNNHALIPLFLYFIPTGTLHWKNSYQLSLAAVYALIVILTTI